MHPFPSPMMIVGGALQFIGKVDGPASGGPATFHADAQEGDLGVIIARGAAVSATGWDVESVSECFVLWKQIEAADLSGVTFGGSVGIWASLVYRGGRRLERVGSATVGSTPPITIPGFTKAGARGLLTAAVTSANMFLTTPSGFSTRQNLVGDGFRYLYGADMLPASGYTNGADIVWTGSGTSGGSAIAFEII